MANKHPKKPVNDLIKFWAEKQDKDYEPVSRSLRLPLSPSASLPPSPLNDNFFSKTLSKDVPANTPPLSPIKQSHNIHSLISEENNNNSSNNNLSIIDAQTLSRKNEERMNLSSLSQYDSSNEETSSPLSSIKSISPIDSISITTRSRDHDLPPVRKVTDLVSKFEKVTSPTNSVSTSPRLNPIKRSQTYTQSSPVSPLALSPIKRNQLTPEPLSLSTPTSTLNSKSKRRQTVPEPLNISSKQITDEPTSSSISPIVSESTPASPISPIGNLSIETPPISVLNFEFPEPIFKRSTVTTEQYTPEVQIQKKPTYPIQQESSSNQSLVNNNVSTQKKVPEQNPNPIVMLSIKQSDPEPLQQQTRPTPTSPPVQSDKLGFLSAAVQSSSFNQINQKNSSSDVPKYSGEHGFFLPEITPSSPFWKPISDDGNIPVSPLWKPVSETAIQISQTKQLNTDSQNNREFKPETTSNSNNASNLLSSLNRYEISDLLPHPEPISPIRLSFSDFIESPNGSSTNLNSNESGTTTQDGGNEIQSYNSFLDMMSTDQSDMYKPEVPRKDENSKPKTISGTIQLIENLRRYLQPNKYKNSDGVNASKRKSTTQNVNSGGQFH